MSADPAFAAWLQAVALYATSATDNAGAWGDSALDRTLISALALAADASAETARQAQILRGPLVIDEHDVVGARIDLLGCCITLTIAKLGYDAGRAVIVIGVQEGAGKSTLTVLARL